MYSQEQLQSLPKLEISFQDDFPGSVREITLTVDYILRKLGDRGENLKIGDKLLLWESNDLDSNGVFDYLCNIGQVVEINEMEIEKEYGFKVPHGQLINLDGKPIFIKIDKKNYFNMRNLNL